MGLKEKALEAIASDIRRRILHLLESGDRSFTEIQTTVELNKGSLNYHMKGLLRSGLVTNIYERRAASSPRLYSYYKLTSFGAYALDWYKTFKGPSTEPKLVEAQ
jgi:predicted transcriptional regulator